METDDLEALDSPPIPSFLRDPLGVLRRRWPWMLLVFTVGALSTTVLVARIQPRYVASATILVTGQQIPEDFVRSTIHEDPLARINAMLGAILSREALAKLVVRHDLYSELRKHETLAEVVILTRDDITIGETKNIGRDDRRKGAQLYTVSFEADNAAVTAAVANDIARQITNEHVKSRTRQAAVTADFLERELKRSEVQLREQNQKIRKFKESHRGELPSELAANLSKMDRLQLQRQSLSLQIAQAETRLATLATRSSSAEAPDVASPDASLLLLEQELAKQLSSRTDRHPDVIALRRRIAALEKDLEKDADLTVAENPKSPPSRLSLLEASQRTIAELKDQLDETETNLRLLDARVASTPARDEMMIALEERESVLREKYLEFLRKFQDAKLAQSLESAQHGERFSLVDPAVEPTHPVRERSLYAAFGGIVSLALAFGVGILLEIRDPVLLSADQLEFLFELPVLGSVSQIEGR